MQYAVPIISGGAPTPFTIPPGITEKAVCSISGTEPSQWCKSGQRNEYFLSDQPPLPASQDLLRRVNLNTWTGLLAGDACKDFVKDDLAMNVNDKFGRQWLRTGQGKDWLESHDMPRNRVCCQVGELKPRHVGFLAGEHHSKWKPPPLILARAYSFEMQS